MDPSSREHQEGGTRRRCPYRRRTVGPVVVGLLAVLCPALAVTAQPGAGPAAGAGTQRISSLAAGRSLVWAEEFNAPIPWGRRWTDTGTSAYRYGTHNPDGGKLDWISPAAATVAGGKLELTARPSDHTLENGARAWATGLITTEGSQEGFQVRTGDRIETRVQLPTAHGAWPALWTWRDGRNEIDAFEYHPEHPGLLELVNHVRQAGHYYTVGNLGASGRWVTVSVVLGANSVSWYVNGALAHSDGRGVGSSFSAYLVLSLSVNSGRYFPPPPTGAPFSFATDYLRVYR